MNTSQILIGLVFSSIGFGYFMYVKKQKIVVPLLCGLILMFYSYFVESTLILSAVGTIFSIIPYFLRF